MRQKRIQPGNAGLMLLKAIHSSLSGCFFDAYREIRSHQKSRVAK